MYLRETKLEQLDSSQTLGKLSLDEIDDIPAAYREGKIGPPPTSFPVYLGKIGLGIGIFVLIMASFFLFERFSPLIWSPQTTKVETMMGPPIPDSFPQPTNLLGHLPYSEAPRNELKPITARGEILMRKTAAEKFLQMQSAARASGISLEVISGFRSVEDQQQIFFQVKEERGQQVSQRAEVSAPPGYSEHHTGYALDIGDARFPETRLSVSFEKTPAYKWLAQNAARYSFELSFPPDNLQGVSYEPWHWRFVGDRHSLETFYQVKNLHQSLKNQP
jgi:zinc D-Ala-D-Ala carboxypeptidase